MPIAYEKRNELVSNFLRMTVVLCSFTFILFIWFDAIDLILVSFFYNRPTLCE